MENNKPHKTSVYKMNGCGSSHPLGFAGPSHTHDELADHDGVLLANQSGLPQEQLQIRFCGRWSGSLHSNPITPSNNRTRKCRKKCWKYRKKFPLQLHSTPESGQGSGQFRCIHVLAKNPTGRQQMETFTFKKKATNGTLGDDLRLRWGTVNPVCANSGRARSRRSWQRRRAHMMAAQGMGIPPVKHKKSSAVLLLERGGEIVR